MNNRQNGSITHSAVIQPITFDTMLNNNGLNIGDGLNFSMCEQTFNIVPIDVQIVIVPFSSL